MNRLEPSLLAKQIAWFNESAPESTSEPAPEPAPEPYDGYAGCWPGDGSGLDDLADLNAQETGD